MKSFSESKNAEDVFAIVATQVVIVCPEKRKGISRFPYTTYCHVAPTTQCDIQCTLSSIVFHKFLHLLHVLIFHVTTVAITNPKTIMIIASKVAAKPETELAFLFGGTELNNNMMLRV